MEFMGFNFSPIDLILIAAVVIVVVWAGLKLVTRLVLGLILVVVLALAFLGFNFQELGLNFGG